MCGSLNARPGPVVGRGGPRQGAGHAPGREEGVAGPAGGSPLLQLLRLGGILILGGTIVNGLVGAYAGQVALYLGANARAGKFFKRISGVLFLGLAARLAFERR